MEHIDKYPSHFSWGGVGVGVGVSLKYGRPGGKFVGLHAGHGKQANVCMG